jgi:hypothetical protein
MARTTAVVEVVREKAENGRTMRILRRNGNEFTLGP